MFWLRSVVVAAVLTALTVAHGPAIGGERSFPADCLPDRVVSWDTGDAPASTLFGAALLPGIVLGPPGDSLVFNGSLSVASVGREGHVILAFDDVVIEDRPGPDFIIFENAFYQLPLPADADDDFTIFAEAGIVSVSADGQQWFEFPYDRSALDAAPPVVHAPLFPALQGLAGVTPTLTGNWTVPDMHGVWDPLGSGGISGAGGDAFDLATVGLSEARFVRIVDAFGLAGAGGSTAGFDLDGIVALHARPLSPLQLDSDGDRLSDNAESLIYGTSPTVADSDSDGVDDGREIAGCRDPLTTSESAQFHAEPRLWLTGGSCSELRWSFGGSGVSYQILRGDLAALRSSGNTDDAGCHEPSIATVRFSCDPETPIGGFYYLVAEVGASTFGRASSLSARTTSFGCP